MGRLATSVTLAAFVCLLQPATAAGQLRAAPQATRGFISINGAFQGPSRDFRDGMSFPEHAEEGRFDVDYTVEAGPSFDIAGGATLVGRLAVGVGVTSFSRQAPATLTGSSPHPFFFLRPRAVSGEVVGLKREELAVHVQVRGLVEPSERVTVMVFGGPSFFKVTQGVVTRMNYDQAYPYDEVTYRDPDTLTADERKVGFNVGADVAFFFARQIGVGGVVQYSGATVELPAAGEGTLEVKAGGLQVGAGLRLRF